MTALKQQIIQCERCPRLRKHCESAIHQNRKAYAGQKYWLKPVPNFGSAPSPLLIVGLAPALHGANRTGRMFTGDRSGEWLYRALHKFGFAKTNGYQKDGDNQLINCTITAVCHCAPPENKPSLEEIQNCSIFLHQSIEESQAKVFLALGQMAWKECLRYAQEKHWIDGKAKPKFSHGQEVHLKNGSYLLGSYHPSQQNTFTGRLTEPMFDKIFSRTKVLVES